MKKIIFLVFLLTFFGTILPVSRVGAQSASCSYAGPDGDAITATSGTRRTYAYGVSNASYMYFPTWTESGGQDDIVWYPGTDSGGGTWYADINLASHTALGNIFVHVYGYNASNVATFCDYANFTRGQQSGGYLDSNNANGTNISCTDLSGWAWDPDFPNTPINIRINFDGVDYATFLADHYRSDLPGNKYHGFTYPFPVSWKNGQSHVVHVYAVDLNGNPSGELTYSPQLFVCAPPPVLTVNSAGNGSGSVSGGGTYNYNYTMNPTYPVVTMGATPNTGSYLAGWSGSDSDCNDGTVTMSSSKTCTATFTLYSYTVSTSAGTGGSISPSSRSVTYGSNTTFTITPSTGYSMASVSGCSGSLSGSTYTTGVITSACTVSATFSPNSYSITFDSAGGSAVSTITQAYGTAISAPANPTRTGYTFAGWSPSLAATMPIGGQSLTATWSPNSYSITFDSAGGSAVSTITQAYGTAISAPANPTRTGYTFAGWSPSIPSTMPANNQTITATWSINSYTVSTSAGTGGSISPSSRSVTYGSPTTFTVTPNSGYVTSSVTGCSGSLSGTTYTTGNIAQNCTVTATFSPISLSVSATTPYATNVSTNVSFAYSASSSVGSVECRLLDNALGALTSYSTNNPIVYTSPSATGSYGYYVQCRSTTDNSVVATSNQIIVNVSGTLTVTKAGTGSGTVTSNPAGISCGSTCAYTYAYDTSVTLTASPSTGITFAGWGGACSGTGTCTVTMSQARSVTATFNSGSYPITWTATNGSASPSSCTYGETVTPVCTPNTGYSTATCPSAFTCSTSNSKTATFTINTYSLTVTKSGTGSGTVTSNPAGISCGSTCAYTYNYNTSITLTATPSSDSTFAGWSGDCSAGGVVTTSAAKACAATFSLNPPSAPTSLTATPSTCGTGTINLSWPAVTGATSYQIYRNGGAVYSNTATSYSDTGLSGSTAYTYTVRASNAGGQSGATATNPVQTTSPVATCNTAPNAPTISGSTTGYPDTSYTFTFTATDAQSDQIRYGIDWNMDGTADEWLPGGVSYVNSGTSRSTSYSWSTTGSKTFRVLTQDAPGVNSGWTNYSVTISAVPVNGVCGTANRTYPVGASSYGSDTYCSAGSASGNPAFPVPGNSVTWVCNGLNGGANSGTCTASNPEEQHTISIDGTPKGIVTSDDGGINCGSDCGGIYEEGTTIYLRAYPISSFWKFTGWSGLCSNDSYLCVLEVAEPGTVVPSFEPRLFDYLEF